MAQNLEASVIQIRDDNGAIHGTGFLIDANIAVTCAHVVEAAGAAPGKTLTIVFALTSACCPAEVLADAWRPVKEDDIAILRLQGELPTGVTPAILRPSSENTAGHPFRAFGYSPLGDFQGVWAEGKILGPIIDSQGTTMLQLDSQQVAQGMSGAPVLDTKDDRVVGMVTATYYSSDRNSKFRDAAFATPIEAIAQIYPPIVSALVKSYAILNIAPTPSKHFVQRPAEFNQLIDHLFNSDDEQKTVTISTALQGGGGFGKTTLARAICHDPRIIEFFSDGILWIEFGQTPNSLGLLNTQIGILSKETSTLSDINLAIARLRELLANRRVLLVLDDVWNNNDARPFLQGGSDCAVLITTRRQDLVTRLKAKSVTVNEMKTDEATELLLKWFDQQPENLQPVSDLAQYLGEWPLLLDLAGAYLYKLINDEQKSINQAIVELKRRLERRGFTYLDRTDEGDRNEAISISLNLSLERLGEWRERYLELGVFPEDIDIPFETIQRLWSQTSDMDDLDTEDALRAMRRLSLFTGYDPVERTIRLHDVIRAYLAKTYDQLPLLHAHLLDAHRPTQPSPLFPDHRLTNRKFFPWADLPTTEPYLWKHLASHLNEAGQSEELVKTVKDLRYLVIKSYLDTPLAVENDLRQATGLAPNDYSLRLLERYFSQSSHLLNMVTELKDKAATLHSRLSSVPALTDHTHKFAQILPKKVLLAQHPLHDIAHPALYRTLIGHNDAIWDCAISDDGRIVISLGGGRDMTLRVWDVETGEEKSNQKIYRNACAISGDGKLIASVDISNVKVLDTQTGEERLTLTGHKLSVKDCDLSYDGQVIVSASDDKTVKVWDGQTGEIKFTLGDHTDHVNACEVSNNGQVVVSASSDQTVKVWDGQTGELRRTLHHNSPVNNCEISGDGRVIVSITDDRMRNVWDGQTGELKMTFPGYWWGCAINSDGCMVVSTHSDNALKVWNEKTDKELLTLIGHTDRLRCCDISSDGRMIVSGSSDRTIKVWDVSITTKEDQQVIQAPVYSAIGCAISNDGKAVVSASFDHTNTIKIWDGMTGQQRLTLHGHTERVRSCAVSGDGKIIVSTAEDNTVRVWDGETGKERLTLTTHTKTAMDCNISVDGQMIVSASSDKTVKVWDGKTGEEKLTLIGHNKAVRCCAVSEDCRVIVSGSADNTVRVWDAKTGNERHILQYHSSQVNDCAVSSDGRILVSVSRDKKVAVWDGETGELKFVMEDHSHPLQSFVTYAYNLLKTAAGEDNDIFPGHTDNVTGCALNRDGQILVTVSSDKLIMVWDTNTGHRLSTLPVESTLNDVACTDTPDGLRIVAAGHGGGVYFLRYIQ